MTLSLKALALAGSIGCCLVTSALPAAAQSQWDALYDRIIRLEHEVKGLRGGGAVATTPQQPAGDSAYRLTNLEEQMRQLMGEMQALSQRVRAMQAQLQEFQGGRKSGALEPEPQIEKSVEVSEPEFSQQQSTESVDLSQYQSQELANLESQSEGETVTNVQKKAPGPKLLGTLTVQQSGELSQATQNSGQGQETSSLLPETVETANLDGTSVAATQTENPDALYESAYDKLLGREFGPAEAEFRLFLSRYGEHPLAGDAQYWLGETYYARSDYKQAAQTFLKGYRSDPKGRKAPDSLFKLAMSLQKLGQKPQACGTFAEVAKEFPKSASLRNQAIKEMQRAGC
jgi:tol-pal system protein YbgF